MKKRVAAPNTLESKLIQAREFAEKLGDEVVLYFIDMAILEAKKNHPELTVQGTGPRATSGRSGQ